MKQAESMITYPGSHKLLVQTISMMIVWNEIEMTSTINIKENIDSIDLTNLKEFGLRRAKIIKDHPNT